MLEFKKWLNEASYTEKEIPPYFYLAPMWKPAQLSRLLLTGVEGISSNYTIAQNFLRHCIIVMDGPKVEAMNHLSRMMYDNPDYLASNNMRAMARMQMVGSHPEAGIEDSLRHKITVMMEAYKRFVAPYSWFDDHSNPKGHHAKVIRYAQQIGSVKNIYDLGRKVHLILSKDPQWHGPPVNQFIDYIKMAIGNNAKMLSKEQEWMVKPKYTRHGEQILKVSTLRIPENSILLVCHESLHEDKPYDRDDIWEYGLMNKYDLREFQLAKEVRDEVERIAKGEEASVAV